MKNCDIFNNKILVILISLLMFSFWSVGFFTEHTLMIENIALLVVGFLVMMCLIIFRNINNIIPFIIFVPFMFARELDPLTIPKSIYIACGFLVFGLIVHAIKVRPKLKRGTLFFGLMFLGIGMVLGGINIKTEYFYYQFGIMFFAVAMFLLVYVYFTSTFQKISFYNISFLMCLLGLFISLQSLGFFIFKGEFIQLITTKSLNVGWGINNNITLMLLVTFPFTVYLWSQSKGSSTVMYLLLLLLQALVIVFSHCRGGTFAFAVIILILILYYFYRTIKYREETQKNIFSVSFCMMFVLSTLFAIQIYDQDIYDRLIKSITNINLDTMNGRIEVYTIALRDLQDNMVFGKGFLYSLFIDDNPVGEYMWGHSTIIQTVSTMGLFGLAGLLYHFIEKYFVLLKKINFEKLIIFLAFLGSGIYGLFDVSYYFINYMVVLILIFIMCEPYFYNLKEERHFKKTNMIKTLEN